MILFAETRNMGSEMDPEMGPKRDPKLDPNGDQNGDQKGDPKGDQNWAQIGYNSGPLFGPLLVLKMAPLRGAVLSENTRNSKGFGAFRPQKRAPCWVPFWCQIWLNFGSILVPFWPLCGAPFGPARTPYLPSLWAGLAGPRGRG